MALRTAAELRVMVLHFREMARLGSDVRLQIELLAVASDLELEANLGDAATQVALPERTKHPA